ncbi:MAG: sensor histidine kinase [Paenibacillus macerans]|uniref:histidine kinase n=1 Tax=Paenibacillus macerans TaxID=44252 RepID=A0A090YLW8_PAEMA|nr:sensor histidine kinase [Paenibacillus macerans]KFM93120.1 histidine kinase family protein [Paenibacillus macerans]MBS5911579.1 sensor histidine kinase [Paenibacillus macerans]MCY7561388.1 sensor histidine kinase [Paenibacillus macerans]MDU5945833.1 sensor histidine kinase [Paenibacillus macerans]MDU7473269.1 sensor histidine kinase [Paenibacillus macerans]
MFGKRNSEDVESPLTDSINELFVSRFPVLLWVLMVFISSLTIQNLGEPRIVNSLLFSAGIVAHICLHWNSYRITKKHPWLYFLVQGLLIAICAYLMPQKGTFPVLIGLFPVLIGQSVGLYNQKRKILLTALFCMLLFFYCVLRAGSLDEIIGLSLMFVFMMIIVMAYALLFFRQVHARLRTQNFLRDLEKAHRKVEELTLANERQRMARDLHDTLAQGLAGLIMQLEAVDAFMAQGNTDRSRDIVKKAMEQARRTLADARRAIDDLRVKSGPDVDFKEAVADEVRRFIQATGIQTFLDIKVTRRLSGKMTEHSLQIISECLTNVTKHAKADKVWVTVSDANNRLFVEIRDNGTGFNTEMLGKQPGRYGILGMQERARLIGGEFHIFSGAEGTKVQMEASMLEGETV